MVLVVEGENEGKPLFIRTGFAGTIMRVRLKKNGKERDFSVPPSANANPLNIVITQSSSL